MAYGRTIDIDAERAAAQPPVSQVAPWLQNAGAAAGLAGTAVSAYGQYQQSQQARKQYEMALQAWREDQERQKRMDAQAQQQQGFQNALTSGQYATGQINDIQDPYLAYSRMLGL